MLARPIVHLLLDFAIPGAVSRVAFREYKMIRLHASLLPHGKLLIAEPKVHVAAKQFQETLEKAQSIGLKLHGQPPIRCS